MDYNKTINLPKTDFPMRAGLPKWSRRCSRRCMTTTSTTRW